MRKAAVVCVAVAAAGVIGVLSGRGAGDTIIGLQRQVKSPLMHRSHNLPDKCQVIVFSWIDCNGAIKTVRAE